MEKTEDHPMQVEEDDLQGLSKDEEFMSAQDLRKFFLSIPIDKLASLLRNQVMVSHALNLSIWESRLYKELLEAEEINQDLLYASLRLKNALLIKYPVQ